MARLQIDWALQTSSGRTRVASLERLVNLFPEANVNINKQSNVTLIGAPGSRPYSIINHKVYYLYSVSNKLFCIADNGLWDVSNKDKPKLLYEYDATNDITMADGYNIADSGTQTNWIWWTDSNDGYVHNVQEGTTNPITDDSFLPASSTTHLDSYAIYTRADSNEFFWSNVADFETFDGLDFASAEGNADNNVRVEAFESDLWFFGEKTIEIWVDVGDSNAPFQRLSNAFLEMGCLSKRSVVKLNRKMYFVGSDKKVYKTSPHSYNLEDISNHQGVEHDLYGLDIKDIKDIYGFGVTLEGHEFYYLTIPGACRTWVYDEVTNSWHERSSLVDGQIKPSCCKWCDDHNTASCENGSYGTHISLCGVNHVGKAYIGTNDGVYQLDLNYFKDGDELIMREATTAQIDFGYQRSSVNKVELEFQNACEFVDSNCSNAAGMNESILLESSKDQSKSWCSHGYKWIVKDNKEYVPMWRNLGQSRSRAWRWRTYYDGQIVFNRSFFTIEDVGVDE